MGEPAPAADALISPLDEELATRYVHAGDREALDCLVRRYSPRLRRLLITLVGTDPDEVMDAEQEVFVALVRKLHRYRGASSFATFFYRVARNRVIDLLRSRGRYRTRIVSMPAAEHNPDPAPLPEDLLLDAERTALLRVAMKRLSPEDQVLLYLKDGEGRGVSELGELTGMPAGTVKSRLARSRRKVAYALEELGYER